MAAKEGKINLKCSNRRQMVSEEAYERICRLMQNLLCHEQAKYLFDILSIWAAHHVGASSARSEIPLRQHRCTCLGVLKGVWHEILDFKFFSWICVPQAPSIPLEPFWFFSKIRGDIRKLMFITGVNATGDKLFSGVNNTDEKFIAGVVDTGEQFIFFWCHWYCSEKNQKA